MRTLWRHLEPTFELRSVAAIDEAFLARHGIRAFIWDVDGTLMSRHGSAVSPRVLERFERLISIPGTRHVILSNCSEDRFAQLGAIFPEIAVLRAYRSPQGVSLRRRLRGQDRWRGHGDGSWIPEGGRQIRKPSKLLIDFAIEELGRPARDEVVAVGDQYLTDIAGANLGGIRSIKVATLERHSFPLAVRQLQRLDRLAFQLGRLRDRLV